MLLPFLSLYTEKLKDGDGKTIGYVYEKVWTDYAQSALSKIFLYAAIVLAVILLAVGIAVRFKKQEALKGYVRTAVAIAVGFAVTVILAMLSLEFLEMSEKGYVFALVLYPSIVLAAVAVLSVAASYVASLFSKKAFRIALITALSALGAAAVALLVCLGVYLASGEAELNNGVQITISENVALYICAAVLLAVVLFFAFFFGRKDQKEFDSKSISYAAVCISMSFALSYFSPWKMPQGGSITIASLLPLMIYSYMFGVKKGVFAGFIYGILQAIQDPWLIHPAQFLLDYPIAFAGIGVAGIFAKTKKLEKIPQIQFALGAVAASVLRFLAHFLSGVFAFSEYSTLDNVWIYSLGYNSFVFVDIAIVVAAGVILFSSRTFVKQMRKFSKPKPNEEESSAEEIQ